MNKVLKNTDSLRIYSLLYSKIRLVRNINKYPFVSSMSKDEKDEVYTQLLDILSRNSLDFSLLNDQTDNVSNIDFNYALYLADEERKIDKNIVLVNKFNTVLEINRDNHIEFYNYSFKSDFLHLYKNITTLEEIFENYFNFYATKRFGFLSPKINDTGLGLKVSTVLHLPGFTALANRNALFEDFNKRGYEIKEWKFEGKCYKNFYVASSNLNFGVSEDKLLERFQLGINSILDMENVELLKFYDKNKEGFVDIILRSYGILSYATKLKFEETIEYLSNILIGLKLGTLKVKNWSLFDLGELFSAILSNKLLSEFNKTDNDEAQREIIKKFISNIGAIND
ncbi:MAG TPA: hypothetical protein PK385_00925 [Spirochaetota bacterium]|nr:hypothetical protein [Spirochaetota bacterium]HOS32123.1 hypothetical protein [Spirochaetota bacterium]HOS54601.1 hypothetical protein [Spirochaetota bacterium]HPK62437.1 hypothetical protein [Spirochaetota bacterium]HQF77099.1 hypothetical protein [Spirochaetota bacterium]